MSNFLIFKAAFNNSLTPEIGTYTVEGGIAYFKIKTNLSPDYYMYVQTAEKPIKWFVPTAVVTDFEFVCDILTRNSNAGYAPYFTIADSNGVTKLRMESQYSNIRFMSDDTHGQSSSVICLTSPQNIGGYGIFHQFRIRVRKLTDSSSSIEVYANNNLVTSGISPALITCGKISFLGATGAFVTDNIGVKNAYIYDLSSGDVVDRGVLSNAFTRFIGWAKGIFALKNDIPTVNDATLTIQQNGVNVQTFTANQATNATANIQCVDLTNNQTVGGIKTFSNAPVVNSISLDGKTIDTDANGNMTYDSHIVDTIEEQGGGYIRYSNGIQICWGVGMVSFNNSTQGGTTLTYPKAFISPPAVNITAQGGSATFIFETIVASYTSSCDVIARLDSVQTVERGFYYTLIGRWK